MNSQELKKKHDTEFAELVKVMTEEQKVILREKIESLLQNPLYVDGQSH